MSLRAIVLLACVVAGSAPSHRPVFAEGVVDKIITSSDKQRLSAFDKSRSDGVAEARAGGSASDVAELDRVLAGEPAPLASFDIRGRWRCRTIELGGLLPLTIYAWFECRITEDGVGFRLEKVSGSQRVSGRFYVESENRLIFVGAGHFAREKPLAYGADAGRDQVGYVTRRSPIASSSNSHRRNTSRYTTSSI